MTPGNMPEALGKYVVIQFYVNANHAVNMANTRSHFGIIIYVNNAPIIWYSKPLIQNLKPQLCSDVYCTR